MRRPPPQEDEPVKPLMSTGFWIALAFGLVCVLGGAGVAWLGVRSAL